MAKSYTIKTNADGTTTTTKTNDDGSKVTSTSSSSNNSYNFKTGKYESSGSSSSKKKKSSSSGSSSSSSSSNTEIDGSWIGPGAADLDKNQTAAAIAGITNQEIESNVGSRPTDNVFQDTYEKSKNKYIADRTNNANDYYKTGDIFQDSAVSKQHYVNMLNAQQKFKDAAAVGDAEGMAKANEEMNSYRRLYGYQEQYANKAITDALLASGAQWVDMRDSSGTFHDDGALVINGKAYDPRTGQPVSTGTQVWNADGTQSWVKNDIQFNGTPYINTNPTRTNSTLENMMGLEQGALDLESAQTLARELGLNSLAEEQMLNDNHAAALRVLRQEALDQLTNGQIDAIIRAGEETQNQLLANLANEALSGGSEGAHAANIVTALLGNNQAITDVTQKYEEQMLAIQDQYNADIASGRIDAYERYTANIMKAKEYAQADLYNQLMAAQIFATYQGQIAAANAQVAAANATASAYNNKYNASNPDPSTGNGILSKEELAKVENWDDWAITDLSADSGWFDENKLYQGALIQAMNNARAGKYADYESFLKDLKLITGHGLISTVDSTVDKSLGYYDKTGKLINNSSIAVNNPSTAVNETQQSLLSQIGNAIVSALTPNTNNTAVAGVSQKAYYPISTKTPGVNYSAAPTGVSIVPAVTHNFGTYSVNGQTYKADDVYRSGNNIWDRWTGAYLGVVSSK